MESSRLELAPGIWVTGLVDRANRTDRFWPANQSNDQSIVRYEQLYVQFLKPVSSDKPIQSVTTQSSSSLTELSDEVLSTNHATNQSQNQSSDQSDRISSYPARLIDSNPLRLGFDCPAGLMIPLVDELVAHEIDHSTDQKRFSYQHLIDSRLKGLIFPSDQSFNQTVKQGYIECTFNPDSWTTSNVRGRGTLLMRSSDQSVDCLLDCSISLYREWNRIAEIKFHGLIDTLNASVNQTINQSKQNGSLTLDQFLIACNLEEMICQFPSVIRSSLQLTRCQLAIELENNRSLNPSHNPSVNQSILHAHARTGSTRNDHLLILRRLMKHSQSNNRTFNRQLSPTGHPSEMTLIKCHAAHLINQSTFPQLPTAVKPQHNLTILNIDQFTNPHTNHSSSQSSNHSVYLDSELNDALCARYLTHIPNEQGQFARRFQSISQPSSQSLNHLSNDQTINQALTSSINHDRRFVVVSPMIPQGVHILTTNQANKFAWTMINHSNDQSNKQSHIRTEAKSQHSDFANNQSILLALFHNSRVDQSLAKYLFDFLDTNDVICGLKHVNRSINQASILTSGSWWKQRLYREHSIHWSDKVLSKWLSDWLVEDSNNLSSVITQSVLDRPLWYNAAVHLQTRINRFVTDIMHEPIPQLNQTINQSNDGMCRPVYYSPPSSLIKLLLTAPPFKPNPILFPDSNDEFTLWQRSNDQSLLNQPGFQSAHNHEDVMWIGSRDVRGQVRLIGLFVGPCFVESDTKVTHMGELVDQSINQSINRIRYTYLLHADDLPVIEWDAQFAVTCPATNTHAFVLKRGLIEQSLKLHKLYEDEANAIEGLSGPILSNDQTDNQSMSHSDINIGLTDQIHEIRFNGKWQKRVWAQLAQELNQHEEEIENSEW